jgi:hypothetical protein
MNIQIDSAARISQRGCPGIAGLSTFLAAMALVILWFAQRVPADPAPQQNELDLALQSTLVQVLSQPNPPQDSESLAESVQVWFNFMYPELALAQRRQDPAFVQAEAESQYQFLNSSAIGAERLKDPEFQRQHEQALQALTNGIGQPVLPLRP